MKSLKDILAEATPVVGVIPKTSEAPLNLDKLQLSNSSDIKKFIAKHTVKKTDDANGNGDDVFDGNDEITFDREKNHYGYNPGDDEKVYEAFEDFESGSFHPEAVDERTRLERELKSRFHHNADYDSHVAYVHAPLHQVEEILKNFGHEHDYEHSFTKNTPAIWHTTELKSFGPNTTHIEIQQRKQKDFNKESLEEYDDSLVEVLTPSMGISKYIDDFVHSKNPRFSGDTKQERIKRAIAAFYGDKKSSSMKESIELKKYTVNMADGSSRTVLATSYEDAKKRAKGASKISIDRNKDSEEVEESISEELSKKEKHNIVKKAVHGKDIGHKGKNFNKVAAKAAKEYGSKEAGEKVAAAAMWKAVAKKMHKEELEEIFEKNSISSYDLMAALHIFESLEDENKNDFVNLLVKEETYQKALDFVRENSKSK